MSDLDPNRADLSHALALQLMGVRPQSLSDEDREQVSRLLLDYAAVTYGGAFRPWIMSLHKWARRYDGSGQAAVVASRLKTAPATAALINGAAAHSFELDDTHAVSLTHPGSVVIAAALAVAAETKSSGAEIVAAIVAGYEAIERIGVAANASKMMKFGYHPTPVFGGFGSATAAAMLYGLGIDGLLSAWGHVLSLCGGSMQFSDESVGADVKRMHGGYAAHHGILATDMAQAGIGGPRRALDGKYGFFTIFGRDANPELLLGEPRRLAIHQTSLKPYACCRQFHAMIDCMIDVTENFSIPSSSIKSVLIRGTRAFREQHMLRRPQSSTAAQYSLPFVVGATLEHGPLKWEAYEPKNLGNSQVLGWADRVELEIDEEIDAKFPGHFGAEVEIRLDDGRVRTKRLLDGLGAPSRAFSWQDVVDKAARVTAGVKSPDEVSRLAHAARNLSVEADVEALQQELILTTALR